MGVVLLLEGCADVAPTATDPLMVPSIWRFRKARSLSLVRPQLIDITLGRSMHCAFWLVGENFLHFSQKVGNVFSTLNEFFSTWLNDTISESLLVEADSSR